MNQELTELEQAEERLDNLIQMYRHMNSLSLTKQDIRIILDKIEAQKLIVESLKTQ